MPNYNPQELQQKYEQWCKLHRQQLEAQQQFLQAEALQNELKDYYLNLQWMTDRETDLPIEHSGDEYSIFSEDALWSMLSDHDELARKWMRLGLDAIDRK
ncbi:MULTISPECIES: DUF4298 domain-containing protein [unclassified Psychrobacter]|uniref:DUF4298 domain-containing protein n=1 Tax=unclassified Psychrobacter TaxID=196806 RepID=UPI0007135955|nr:DUF4298 domain-containing protein [Psychrobacter sp. P11F6]KRG33783.1 hypothetical protein AK822_02105 [Psychrobacter sp. P11F6]